MSRTEAKPFHIKLLDAERSVLETVRVRLGLRSEADAARYLFANAHALLDSVTIRRGDEGFEVAREKLVGSKVSGVKPKAPKPARPVVGYDAATGAPIYKR